MQQIKIGIIMGSQSDWPTMQEAANILDDLGINFEKKILTLFEINRFPTFQTFSNSGVHFLYVKL